MKKNKTSLLRNSDSEKILELITNNKIITITKTKRSEIIAIQQNNDGGTITIITE